MSVEDDGPSMDEAVARGDEATDDVDVVMASSGFVPVSMLVRTKTSVASASGGNTAKVVFMPIMLNVDAIGAAQRGIADINGAEIARLWMPWGPCEVTVSDSIRTWFRVNGIPDPRKVVDDSKLQ